MSTNKQKTNKQTPSLSAVHIDSVLKGLLCVWSRVIVGVGHIYRYIRNRPIACQRSGGGGVEKPCRGPPPTDTAVKTYPGANTVPFNHWRRVLHFIFAFYIYFY